MPPFEVLWPLIILVLGIVTVIGMILVLRVNAFIALVTAAMVVSLLSPGELGGKIARAAEAFGGVAGKIGIVIAMAAVIGKCLMDSGAADRIVRSFLRVLGEGRASVALMGSGFVLSVPVFFDTVFYLLVPLARSLWKKTRHNYVLYITAIAAGGAITHTLVPPTPGPLVMADTLKVKIGMMILVGTMIGLPTAAVGLVICHLMNRIYKIPMRPYAGEPELEPLPDDRLPPLWLSLLPVILPVILISGNTVTEAMADAEHTVLMQQGDPFDWAALGRDLAAVDAKPDAPPAKRQVWDLLPARVQETLRSVPEEATPGTAVQGALKEAVTGLAGEPDLRRRPALSVVTPPARAKRLLDRGWQKLSPEEQRQVNWMLLEAVFPDQVKKTPRRTAAGITGLLGDPNLALLLSAAIAMVTLTRQRKLSLKQLAVTTETALMSGGVIILITAGGGAFGAMLREAGVKGSIQELVNLEGGNVGLVLLVLGFAIAVVMKIAQGSGTVSMITTSAMIAAMGISPDLLGFHPVYLCTAIGAGSLVGTWMNDSGFWIFARMSGLTELEALKTWTILLAILGVAAMGFTLLFASFLPLVPAG